MDTKVCKACGQELPITEFYPHYSTRDKLQHVCKRCISSQRSKDYNHKREALKTEYFKKSMLFHLAWIGYKALKNKHGEVTYDVVRKYTPAPRAMTERAIDFFKNYEDIKEGVDI